MTPEELSRQVGPAGRLSDGRAELCGRPGPSSPRPWVSVRPAPQRTLKARPLRAGGVRARLPEAVAGQAFCSFLIAFDQAAPRAAFFFAALQLKALSDTCDRNASSEGNAFPDHLPSVVYWLSASIGRAGRRKTARQSGEPEIGHPVCRSNGVASEFFSGSVPRRKTPSPARGKVRGTPSFRRAAMGFTASVAALCLAVVLLGSSLSGHSAPVKRGAGRPGLYHNAGLIPAAVSAPAHAITYGLSQLPLVTAMKASICSARGSDRM